MTTATEQLVSLPVINPDTGHKSRTFVYRGKVDRVEGGTLIDWKSCADPNRFIRSKKIGFQPYLYAMAVEAAGTKLDTIEYRLITTPKIKMCSKDTNAAAYEDRCVEWLGQDGKLVTHQLMLNPARMVAAKEYLWEASKRILDSRLNHRWLPNENACHMWERVCEYAPLCEAVAEGADVKWLIDEHYGRSVVHQELGGGNRDELTYSSLSTLTLCERKYYWQIEQGLRKKLDYTEALWLGSAMHAGLEAFVEGGRKAAGQAIARWEQQNPAIGDDVRYNEQQAAKARAMVRAAAERWEL